MCSRRFSDGKHLLSGEGARINAGRWNEPGLRLVYASESVSLALLEQLAHLNPENLPDDLVAVRITVPPDAPGAVLDVKRLPGNWRERDNPECARIGSEWIRTGAQLWLSVPSAVNPLERNVLLNPQHPEIERCALAEPIAVVYDERLIRLVEKPAPKKRKTR